MQWTKVMQLRDGDRMLYVKSSVEPAAMSKEQLGNFRLALMYVDLRVRSTHRADQDQLDDITKRASELAGLIGEVQVIVEPGSFGG